MPVKEKGSPSKHRKAPEAWTAEEESIFLEVIDKVLKINLYREIKADGRLQRESPAVRAHLIALMNKLKKGQ
ncbi:uncharacterized protein L199_005831 [Kwoniella botswanensis]|uniref:uncharacterized protein n=1 Tax=Kwoniella botswanensis TaxID=1268659 RepID=UPI00315CC6C5